MFSFVFIDVNRHTKKIQCDNLAKKMMDNFKEEMGQLEAHIPYNMVLGKGMEGKLVGAALLQKVSLYEVQEDIQELVTDLLIHDNIWMCSDIIFDSLKSELHFERIQLDYFSRSFYRELYNAFVEFGHLKGINFMIMKLPSHVYLFTKEYGLWPYVVELRPHHSTDKLFHGILPLKGTQSLAYQKNSEGVS